MHNKTMHIEFDPAKNITNIKKHGIDLVDVEGVFHDPVALTMEDREHREQRFVTLGTDSFGRLLVVVYTWRDGDVIRVISARRADSQERKAYEEKR